MINSLLADSESKTVAELLEFFATMQKLYPSKGHRINYYLIMPQSRLYARLEPAELEDELDNPQIHFVKMPRTRALAYPQVIQLSKEDIESGTYDA